MYLHQRHQQTLLQRLGLRLGDLLLTYDFEYAELLSALAAAGWGAWLLSPWWSAYGASPAFRSLAEVLPEWALGLVMLIVGVAGVVGILADHLSTRRAATMAAFSLWVFVSVLLIQANWTGTSTVVYPLIASAAGWSFLRLRWRRGA